MMCDGCNGTVRGQKYRCLDCQEFVLCSHCKMSGIHSHHEVTDYNKWNAKMAASKRLHQESNPTKQAITLSIKASLGATNKKFLPLPLLTGKDPEAREHSEANQGLPYNIQPHDLPYGIQPVAPPIDVPAILPPFDNLKEGKGCEPHLNTPGLQKQQSLPSCGAHCRRVPAPPIRDRRPSLQMKSRDNQNMPNTATTKSFVKDTPMCVQVPVATSVSPSQSESKPTDNSYGIVPMIVPIAAPVTTASSRGTGNSKEVDVKRQDDFAKKWAPISAGVSFQRRELLASDPEHQAVIENMKKNGGKKWTTKVDSICRVENDRLFNSYRIRRDDLERENDPSIQNERILWHGTSADVLTNIYRDGFNRSYCGKNATAYGDGVYFATSFDYSASSAYSPADANGQKYIFQCRVLTGHYIKGQKGLKEPPMRDAEMRYDSVVDNMKDPAMFVIFKDMQVYPEYVITLKA